MPRKNARPAARKRRLKLKAKLTGKQLLIAKCRSFDLDPRLGDELIIAALASRYLR